MQYINNMRGVAILMILAAHALSCLPNFSSYAKFFDYMIGNGTVLFIFISGYIFSASLSGFKYVEYLKGKVFYVVLPYLILSLPANLLYALALKTDHVWIDMGWFLDALNPVQRYLYLVVTGASLGPLWFIPMAALFFLAAPLFERVSRLRLEWLLFLVSLVAAIILGRPKFNANALQGFVFYMPAYLLGMMGFRHAGALVKVKQYALGAFLTVCLAYALSFVILFWGKSEFDQTVSVIGYLPVVLAMTALFYKYLNKKNVFLDMFARLSFFIFFIHGYFTAVIRAICFKYLADIGVLSPPLEFGLFFLIFITILTSSLILFIIFKFFLKSKSRFLIGA